MTTPKFYYNLDSLSTFTQAFDRLQGVGDATGYFYQSPLYSDIECSNLIEGSFIIFEGIYHIIDGIVQPFIAEMSLFFSTGQVIAIVTLDELFFPENDPKDFVVIEARGTLKCAKITRIINIGNEVREVDIIFKKEI